MYEISQYFVSTLSSSHNLSIACSQVIDGHNDLVIDLKTLTRLGNYPSPDYMTHLDAVEACHDVCIYIYSMLDTHHWSLFLSTTEINDWTLFPPSIVKSAHLSLCVPYKGCLNAARSHKIPALYAFEVVWDKRICNCASTPFIGLPLKTDPDAVVFVNQNAKGRIY